VRGLLLLCRSGPRERGAKQIVSCVLPVFLLQWKDNWKKEGFALILQESFLSALCRIDDEYEMIAICYSELLAYVPDHDNNFIAKVDHLDGDPEFKTCAPAFERLRQTVVEKARQANLSADTAGTGFPAFCQEVADMLRQFELPDGVSEKSCAPVCIFYVLEALDCYIEGNLRQSQQRYSDRRGCGPLNRDTSREKCLVYLTEQTSFLSQAYSNNAAGFRRPLHPTRVGEMFQMVLLFETAALRQPPSIRPLRVDPEHPVRKNKRFLIASIPFIGFDTFRFHEVSREEPCGPGQTPDGNFYVEYSGEEEQAHKQKLLDLLKSAVEQGANIILFPEFIMSPAMEDALQNHLRSMDDASQKQLLAVFAGTGYHWDGKTGNNILQIFDGGGVRIGCCYKRSSFLKRQAETFHGAALSAGKDKAPDGYAPRRYLECCEMLSDPGKECRLLDIDGIGRVMPAICRDVVDGGDTAVLAEQFLPSLLAVPAWSPSVHAFQTRFTGLAETIHTASLLCNCCNAVKDRKTSDSGETVTGLFCMPKKTDGYMQAESLLIRRPAGCAETCGDRGGCVVMLEVDFSRGLPSVKIVNAR